MAKHSKVLILGSGPAGYTAAIYAARAMLKPILVFGSEPGGQLTTTPDVENFPGYSKVIQGPWLMEEMKGQAKAVGTEMIQDHIKKVDLSKKPFEAVGDSGQVYSADSFIIFPPPSSWPANIPPSITKSAPPPNAFATSPGHVHPPSAIMCAPKP